MLKWALPALLALGLLLNPWPIHVHADGPPTVHQVASGLMCQCGCGLTVASCQESMTCTVANGIVQQIQRQIDEGKSKQEIQEYFVSLYGEQILALPRKSGFSLTAWTTPFLAVALGAVVVSAVVWFWVKRRSVLAGAGAPSGPPSVTSAYEERVDQDLRMLE